MPQKCFLSPQASGQRYLGTAVETGRALSAYSKKGEYTFAFPLMLESTEGTDCIKGY